MKKQFTAENLATLKQLYTEFSFKGEVLEGKFGANTLNPFELLTQTTVPTLRSLFATVKKLAQATSELDEWSLTEHQLTKQKGFEAWAEFLNLLIGYRLSEEERADKLKTAKKVKAELAELKDNAKTPAERIAEKERELAELEGKVLHDVVG